jgi:hypothetical protein
MRPLIHLWTAALCVCALVGFIGAIAGYNVAQSRDLSARDVRAAGLSSLASRTTPAMDNAFQLRTVEPALVSRRNCLVKERRQDTASWNAFSFEAGCNCE